MKKVPVLTRCHSRAQFASFGPLPPRTPGRPDPQVPEDIGGGAAIYAKLPHLYFYDANRADDPAFGFIEIEISVQSRGQGRYLLDLYSYGDGHQNGAGLPNGEGVSIELMAGDKVIAAVSWVFGTVHLGRCDPMTFSAPLTMSDEDFAAIDRVRLPPTAAICRTDG